MTRWSSEIWYPVGYSRVFDEMLCAIGLGYLDEACFEGERALSYGESFEVYNRISCLFSFFHRIVRTISSHAWYLWNSHVTRDACAYQVRDEDVLLVCECDRARSRTESQCLSHLHGFSWHASGPLRVSRRSRSTSMTCALMYRSYWKYFRSKELFLPWSSDGIPDHAALFSDRNWGRGFDARRWNESDISDPSHAYREWRRKTHSYR